MFLVVTGTILSRGVIFWLYCVLFAGRTWSRKKIGNWDALTVVYNTKKRCRTTLRYVCCIVKPLVKYYSLSWIHIMRRNRFCTYTCIIYTNIRRTLGVKDKTLLSNIIRRFYMWILLQTKRFRFHFFHVTKVKLILSRIFTLK